MTPLADAVRLINGKAQRAAGASLLQSLVQLGHRQALRGGVQQPCAWGTAAEVRDYGRLCTFINRAVVDLALHTTCTSSTDLHVIKPVHAWEGFSRTP